MSVLFSTQLIKEIERIHNNIEALWYVGILAGTGRISPLHLYSALEIQNEWFVKAMIQLGYADLIRDENFQPLVYTRSITIFNMMLDAVVSDITSSVVSSIRHKSDRECFISLLQHKLVNVTPMWLLEAVLDEDYVLVDFYLTNYYSQWPSGAIYQGEQSVFNTIINRKDEQCMRFLLVHELYQRDIAVTYFTEREDVLSIDDFVNGVQHALCQDRISIKATIVAILTDIKTNNQKYDVLSIMKTVVSKHGFFSQLFLFNKPQPSHGFYNDWVKLLERMWLVIDH